MNNISFLKWQETPPTPRCGGQSEGGAAPPLSLSLFFLSLSLALSSLFFFNSSLSLLFFFYVIVQIFLNKTTHRTQYIHKSFICGFPKSSDVLWYFKYRQGVNVHQSKVLSSLWQYSRHYWNLFYLFCPYQTGVLALRNIVIRRSSTQAHNVITFLEWIFSTRENMYSSKTGGA